MTNIVADFRQQTPGTVSKRTRNSIHIAKPDGKKIALIHSGPIHYGPTFELECDTAWEPAVAPWQYQMVRADFNAYALENFSNGQIVRYVHPTTGADIRFQPQQLQWTNDLNQVEPIADVASVLATVTDDVLRWNGAYGAGRDFIWQTATNLLAKRLILGSALPPPPQFIIDGGNPVLRLQFIFALAAGVDVFVDGVLWDKISTVTTGKVVEFRSTATGAVLWLFQPPFAVDSVAGEIGALTRFRRSGNSLFIEVRVPYAWLAAATYPVEIDPTLSLQPDGTAGKDTWVAEGATGNNFGARENLHMRGVSDRRKTLLEFDLSSIGSDQVCDAATLYMYTFTSTGTGNGTIYSIASGNEAWIEGNSNGAASAGEPTWDNRVHAIAAWAGSAGLSTSGTDYEASSIGTFSHASDALGTEKTASLDTTRVAGWFDSPNTNYGMLMTADGAYYLYICSSEHATSTFRPKLVVEYSELEIPIPPATPAGSGEGQPLRRRPLLVPQAPFNIQPVIYQGNLLGNLGQEVVTRLRDSAPSYNHELTATGGYWAAALSGTIDEGEIPFWIANGLARHVDIFDGTGDRIWQGFVNEITLNIGGLSITIGPLKEVANRVRTKYTTIRWNTNPPIGGDEAVSAWVSDTDSQGRYGILSAEVSGGELSVTEAVNLATGYLATYKKPQVSQSLSVGGNDQFSIQLGLLGYIHYLDFFIYTRTGAAAAAEISVLQKLTNILDADPNGLFASTNADLTDAPTSSATDPVGDFDDSGNSGLQIISDIAERGDAVGNRYYFTVYDGLKFSYKKLVTGGEDYHYTLRDNRQIITRAADGSEVPPWQVRPGNWLFITDFSYGSSQAVSLSEDLRAMFIESVRYTAPFGLQIDGGRVRGINQTLARKTGIMQSGLVSYGGGNPFSSAPPPYRHGFADFYSLFGNFVPPNDPRWIGPPRETK